VVISNNYVIFLLNTGIEQNDNLTKNQKIIKFYVRYDNKITLKENNYVPF